MKNIFKIMGIAVLACSMMVACKPDNNGENNNNNNDDPQPTTPSAKVTFGNHNWDASVAEVYTANYADFGLNEYFLFKEEGAYPFIEMMISAQPGTYQHEAYLGNNTEGGYTYYQWQTGQTVDELYLPLYRVQYFESMNLGQNDLMGDWQPVSANLTVSAYDPNTLSSTFTLTATMYDYYSWYADLVTNAEDADTKTLEIKVNNFTFTEITD